MQPGVFDGLKIFLMFVTLQRAGCMHVAMEATGVEHRSHSRPKLAI
jgi:hypothetical protein